MALVKIYKQGSGGGGVGTAVILAGSGTGSSYRCGTSNTASGNYSMAWGKCVTASGRYSTASGYYSTASGAYSTASGYRTTASGYLSTASGCCTTASGYYFASVHNGLFNHIGNTTNSNYANYGVVLNGNANNTTGGTWSGTYWSVAPTPANSGCHSFIGNGFQNRASGSCYATILNGCFNTASGNSSTASGFYSTASGAYSTASALGTTASGLGSNASGFLSIASGLFSTASGYYSLANGNYSTASGCYTTASGNLSTASGYGTTASGNLSTASGRYTTASGYYSTASGYGTTGSAYYSTASGRYTTASECFTLAQGLRACASQFGQRSWANASYSGGVTDQQQVQYNLSNVTTDAIPSFLWLTGSSLGGGEISIKPNSMMLLNILTSGIETTGTNVATSQDYVVITNVGGTTSIVHQSNIKQHYSAGGLGITILADNTNDVLRIQVVGNANTFRWMSYVYATEILYAT